MLIISFISVKLDGFDKILKEFYLKVNPKSLLALCSRDKHGGPEMP